MHRIRRQRWTVRTATAEQAFAVRTWLHEHCTGELQDALEAGFDRVAPGDGVVRLERLVLTVRVDAVERLVDVLPSRVADAVTTPLRPGTAQGAVVVDRPTIDNDESRLIEYLLSGSVAWPVRPDAPGLLPALVALARSSPIQVAARVARVARDARTLRVAVFRLLQLVNERDWPAVVAAAGGSAEIASGANAPAQAGGPVPEDSPDRRLRLVMSRLIGTDGRDTPKESQQDTAPDVGMPAHTDSMRPDLLERTVSDAAPIEIDELPLVDHRHTSSPAAPHEPSAGTDAPGYAGFAPTPFATAVTCAGLVLLHPYLPQFFRSLGVDLQHGSGADSDAVARAAALLHFVATGRDEPFELELGFVKILLGLAPDTPVVIGAGLITDADREEAAALLQAAIDHWGALKQTSTQALRTSFLQRSGLVRLDENGWRLRVEPSPFDMLLTRLPWSLALVKLPWMHTPLHCDWPTP